MLPRPSQIKDSEKATEFVYAGASAGDIVAGIDTYFRNRRYRLESGEPGSGVYGCGSNICRVLFGAFAKRYAFMVLVGGDNGSVVLRLEKGMSGAMGGVIGYKKMNKEFQAIRGDLSAGVA
jgi:hypothetical protein